MNFKIKIVSILAFMASGFALVVAPVSADIDPTQQENCNPGPYGISDTCDNFGLVTDEEGNIKPEFIAASTVAFSIGVVLLLNGATLNKKIEA